MVFSHSLAGSSLDSPIIPSPTIPEHEFISLIPARSLARVLDASLGRSLPGPLSELLESGRARDLSQALDQLNISELNTLSSHWGSSLEEIASIARERDPRSFYSQLFHLGQSFEDRHQLEIAGLVYSALLAENMGPVPAAILSRAQSRLHAIDGTGEAGAHLAVLSRSALHELTESGLILNLGVARAGATIAEALFAGSRTASLAASLSPRALGISRWFVRSGTEAAIFTGWGMGSETLSTGHTEHLTLENFGTHWASMLVTFGLLHGIGMTMGGFNRALTEQLTASEAGVLRARASGIGLAAAERSVFGSQLRVEGMSVATWGARVLGLTGAGYLNESLGLEEARDESLTGRMIGSLVMDAQMMIAGHAVDGLSGGRLTLLEHASSSEFESMLREAAAQTREPSFLARLARFRPRLPRLALASTAVGASAAALATLSPELAHASFGVANSVARETLPQLIGGAGILSLGILGMVASGHRYESGRTAVGAHLSGTPVRFSTVAPEAGEAPNIFYVQGAYVSPSPRHPDQGVLFSTTPHPSEAPESPLRKARVSGPAYFISEPEALKLGILIRDAEEICVNPTLPRIRVEAMGETPPIPQHAGTEHLGGFRDAAPRPRTAEVSLDRGETGTISLTPPTEGNGGHRFSVRLDLKHPDPHHRVQIVYIKNQANLDALQAENPVRRIHEETHFAHAYLSLEAAEQLGIIESGSGDYRTLEGLERIYFVPDPIPSVENAGFETSAPPTRRGGSDSGNGGALAMTLGLASGIGWSLFTPELAHASFGIGEASSGGWWSMLFAGGGLLGAGAIAMVARKNPEASTLAQPGMERMEIFPEARRMGQGGADIPPDASGRGVRAGNLRQGSESQMLRSLGLRGDGKFSRLRFYRNLVESAIREDVSREELNDRLDWLYREFEQELSEGGYLSEDRIQALALEHSEPNDGENTVEPWATESGPELAEDSSPEPFYGASTAEPIVEIRHLSEVSTAPTERNRGPDLGGSGGSTLAALLAAGAGVGATLFTPELAHASTHVAEATANGFLPALLSGAGLLSAGMLGMVAGSRSSRPPRGPETYREASYRDIRLMEARSRFRESGGELRDRVRAISEFSEVLRDSHPEERENGILELMDLAIRPDVPGLAGHFATSPEDPARILRTFALEAVNELLREHPPEPAFRRRCIRKMVDFFREAASYLRPEYITAPEHWPTDDPRYLSPELIREQYLTLDGSAPSEGFLDVNAPLRSLGLNILRLRLSVSEVRGEEVESRVRNPPTEAAQSWHYFLNQNRALHYLYRFLPAGLIAAGVHTFFTTEGWESGLGLGMAGIGALTLAAPELLGRFVIGPTRERRARWTEYFNEHREFLLGQEAMRISQPVAAYRGASPPPPRTRVELAPEVVEPEAETESGEEIDRAIRRGSQAAPLPSERKSGSGPGSGGATTALLIAAGGIGANLFTPEWAQASTGIAEAANHGFWPALLSGAGILAAATISNVTRRERQRSGAHPYDLHVAPWPSYLSGRPTPFAEREGRQVLLTLRREGVSNGEDGFYPAGTRVLEFHLHEGPDLGFARVYQESGRWTLHALNTALMNRGMGTIFTDWLATQAALQGMEFGIHYITNHRMVNIAERAQLFDPEACILSACNFTTHGFDEISRGSLSEKSRILGNTLADFYWLRGRPNPRLLHGI